MKILITGCMGFIGSNLTIRLLNKGHEIIGIDNRTNCALDVPDRIKRLTNNNWQNFDFYSMSVTENESLSAITIKQNPEVIIHLAAMGSVSKSFKFPEKYIINNELGFVSVVASANLAKVKKIIYASSSSVYGNSQDKIRKEGISEGAANSPYALTKIHNEMYSSMCSKLMPICFQGLRFFNVYGPGQRFDSEYSAVIPKFINSEKELCVFGGSQIRDFTYVDDVCDSIECCFETNCSFIINVGTGTGTSINDLAKKLSNGREIVHLESRCSDVSCSIADIEMAKKIGFISKTDLTKGLEMTKEFYDEYQKKSGK